MALIRAAVFQSIRQRRGMFTLSWRDSLPLTGADRHFWAPFESQDWHRLAQDWHALAQYSPGLLMYGAYMGLMAIA
jgi:hypothetical protein